MAKLVKKAIIDSFGICGVFFRSDGGGGVSQDDD